MATTTIHLQHPLHDQHPLESQDFSEDSFPPRCSLCYRKIRADGYACKDCLFYAHRVCAEIPPRIDFHPLHTDHPLTLTHRPPLIINRICNLCGTIQDILFRCNECDFQIDIGCTLSTLSDRGGTQGKPSEQIELPLHIHKLTSFSTRNDFIVNTICVICKASVEGDGHACLDFRCEFIIHKGCIRDLFGDEYEFNLDIFCATSTQLEQRSSEGKTPKWIALPLHHHLLTLFSTRYDFVKAIDCVICKTNVEGDTYACLKWQCEFLIHKRCIQDLYYADGTKAPHVYHGHTLENFLGEDTGSRGCKKCGSDESSAEFIGCAECQLFYCRDCVQVPEIIQYPHHPDHNLVLLINFPANDRLRCDSCLVFLEELWYGCPSCEFFVDVECALQVLAYCEEGMSTEIELSWHKHPLLLCNGIGYCSYCEVQSAGPMYTCKEERCVILLHKRCTEVKSTIIHSHHPDHPLTLCNKGDFQRCEACSETIWHLYFSCTLCVFYLHAKCAAHVPSRKHYLHEHELLHLDKALFCECNRCGASTNASLFRCVPCNFNLHEKCMELPQVVKHDTHVHPLTLQETYVEDDSGEYYCDLCEKRRDGRLGVYVCGQCTARWAFHIDCILPELRKVFARKGQSSVIKTLDKKIASIDEEVHKTEEKLKGMKRQLDELMKQRVQIISREEMHYAAITREGEAGNLF